jgi:hypothetical protein
MVAGKEPLETNQPPTNCTVILTWQMVLCVEQASHSVFWATLMHQSINLLEQSFPQQTSFEEGWVIIY